MGVHGGCVSRHIRDIDRSISGLVNSLFQLAPRPGQAQGAAFIRLNTAFNPAADYDSTLGCILADSTLGGAFSFAANDNGSESGAAQTGLTLDNIIDAASEYMEERSDAHNNYGRGRGSIALYEEKKKRLAPAFSEAKAYHRDMYERIQTEGHIAALLRKRAEYSASLPSPAYAVA